jgi:hypothetical protein
MHSLGIIIIISPPQSTAGYRPFNCSPSTQSSGTRTMPAVPRKLSLHQAWGRPTLRLPRFVSHSRTLLPQLLSVLRLIWLAHCHFSVLILCAMPVTLVLCQITSFRIRFRKKCIVLSIPRWTSLNLWTSSAESDSLGIGINKENGTLAVPIHTVGAQPGPTV